MRIAGLPDDLVACDKCQKLVHTSHATRDGLAHMCDKCLQDFIADTCMQDFRASLEPAERIEKHP